MANFLPMDCQNLAQIGFPSISKMLKRVKTIQTNLKKPNFLGLNGPKMEKDFSMGVTRKLMMQLEPKLLN